MTVPGTFRAAVEAKDLAAITGTLDPGIEFHSPVMVKPYQGRDAVTALLRVLLEVFEDFHYTDELVSSAPGRRHDPTAAVPLTPTSDLPAPAGGPPHSSGGLPSPAGGLASPAGGPPAAAGGGPPGTSAYPTGGPPVVALIFSARVMGKHVQGLDLIRFNDAGLVSVLTVMVRPLPAAMTLARLVGRRMEEEASA
ncbi:nuclear transport factor 2 family protein [Spirillospora sp. NPDC047279]|uniref:nuclear transport factor 2 family protein n=1 Tax=Spirillospora sp. NPDC047279 TaxID=3155478 RepID=UPI0033D641E5